MENLIRKRIINLSNIFTIPLLLGLEILAITLAYHGRLIPLILVVIIYLLFPYILSPKLNVSYSWGTSRGIFIIIDSIFKRKGIIGFYITIYFLSYIMGFSMILNHAFVGMLSVLLIFGAKIILYFLAYYLSKSYKYYEDFDKLFTN